MAAQRGEEKRIEQRERERHESGPPATPPQAGGGRNVGEAGEEVEPHDVRDIVAGGGRGRALAEEHPGAGKDAERAEQRCEDCRGADQSFLQPG